MDAQQIRLQLDRILTSAAFAEAERAKSLLRFVVERTLDGHPGEIKESVIALEVLGRNSSFDSKTDPIVRVEAGRLRGRLRSYYEAEGEEDAVLISLPKGCYVPEFTERQPRYTPKSTGVLRLSILPPENAPFESFVVSPDGRNLAFTAPLNGRMMLWVRALDSLEVRPLAGTDYASSPFWSPDGVSVGFCARSKLSVVEVNGGPPREIADLIVGRGGAWSPEGVIVFCPRPLGPLFRVSAAGGTPSPLTSLDEARAEVAHGFPHFLPDGRQFLYLAASFRPGNSSIRAGSLDSKQSKVLLSADGGAVYAPVLPGHPPSLLFVHDGALIAQAFDWRRLELSGGRKIVVPEVRQQRWQQSSFSVSSSGVLLYQGAQHQQLSWFDRRGKLLATVGPPNDCLSFVLSPNERYVALHRHDDPDTVLHTIWVMDLLRESAVFRFTDADLGEPEFTPVWSPDSREILFSRGDDRRMRLFRQAVSGAAAQCVLDTEGPKFPSDWSSDRQFVAYTSQVPDYRTLHVWTVALSGPEQDLKPRLFLQHSYEEHSAQFSPAEGSGAPRWLAYASHETGRLEIYVRNFPDGTHKWQVSSHGGVQPRWRRDGQELFYLGLDGALMSVPLNPNSGFDFGAAQPLFSTGLRYLTRYAVWMNQYSVSRDGQRFLLNRHLPEATQGAITVVIP